MTRGKESPNSALLRCFKIHMLGPRNQWQHQDTKTLRSHEGSREWVSAFVNEVNAAPWYPWLPHLLPVRMWQKEQCLKPAAFESGVKGMPWYRLFSHLRPGEDVAEGTVWWSLLLLWMGLRECPGTLCSPICCCSKAAPGRVCSCFHRLREIIFRCLLITRSEVFFFNNPPSGLGKSESPWLYDYKGHRLPSWTPVG